MTGGGDTGAAVAAILYRTQSAKVTQRVEQLMWRTWIEGIGGQATPQLSSSLVLSLLQSDEAPQPNTWRFILPFVLNGVELSFNLRCGRGSTQESIVQN